MESETNIVKPEGSLWIPTLLCGGCGALLAVVVSLSGVLASIRDQMKEYILAKEFFMEDMWQLSIEGEWAVAGGVSLCMAFFVLDSAKFWRQLLLAICASSLILCSAFTLALWGVLFIPISILLSVVATWLFAVLYASQHTMPCEHYSEVQKISEIKDSKLIEEKAEDLVNEEPVSSQQTVPLPKIGKAQKKFDKVIISTKEKTNG